MGRAYSSLGEKRIAFRVLRRKPERKRPLEKTSRRQEDNIKMDLTETG
jgi:hypothetical protein